MILVCSLTHMKYMLLHPVFSCLAADLMINRKTNSLASRTLVISGCITTCFSLQIPVSNELMATLSLNSCAMLFANCCSELTEIHTNCLECGSLLKFRCGLDISSQLVTFSAQHMLTTYPFFWDLMGSPHRNPRIHSTELHNSTPIIHTSATSRAALYKCY